MEDFLRGTKEDKFDFDNIDYPKLIKKGYSERLQNVAYM